MSSTPLFDSVIRSREQAAVPTRSATPVPTSPMSAPLGARSSATVPASLVAAIDDIPQRVAESIRAEHRVSAEQLVLVEAVADAITRAVVDAVVAEVDRITRDGVVRA
jgi:hypothetical protein